MILEISLAANFLIDMLKLRHNTCTISELQLDLFRRSLSNILLNRYKEHWFPERPNRGSGYRCIRINTKMDPLIIQAGCAAGLHVSCLRKYFPNELTLWIDPHEVSYRIGEGGSICVLYERPNQLMQAAPPRESPELYHDPRQMEQPDPMMDYVMGNRY